MRRSGFTKQERNLVAAMRILAVAFFLSALLFALAPDYFVNYLMNIGAGLFDWTSPQIRLGEERFWLVPVVALQLMLAYLCMVVQRNPARNIGYARPVILVKFLSAAGFFACLALSERHFFYLMAGSTDAAVFLVCWHLYAGASKSRAQ